MYYNQEEMTEKVIVFCVICFIIFVLNLTGIIYGIYQDNQYVKAKQAVQTLKEEQETGNVLEDTENTCKYGANQLAIALKVFVSKILIGVIISAFLIIPNLLYKLAEKETLKCMIPDNRTENIVFAIMFAMTLYNMISPFFEIGDYVSLMNEITDVLSELKIDKLINSLITFGY